MTFAMSNTENMHSGSDQVECRSVPFEDSRWLD